MSIFAAWGVADVRLRDGRGGNEEISLDKETACSVQHSRSLSLSSGLTSSDGPFYRQTKEKGYVPFAAATTAWAWLFCAIKALS